LLQNALCSLKLTHDWSDDTVCKHWPLFNNWNAFNQGSFKQKYVIYQTEYQISTFDIPSKNLVFRLFLQVSDQLLFLNLHVHTKSTAEIKSRGVRQLYFVYPYRPFFNWKRTNFSKFSLPVSLIFAIRENVLWQKPLSLN
jgi:hypothetical protein